MSRLQFNTPQVSPLDLLFSSAALSLGSQHCRGTYFCFRRSVDPQQPDSAQRQRMVTHVYSQVISSCAKQSTACFAAEIVTQGVHLKGKPVLNDGTAILNFFSDLAP
jgi:hypothetical protein